MAELNAEDIYDVRLNIRRIVEKHGAQFPGPAAAPGGYDEQLWELLAGQVGAAGLAIPEELGGAGCGYRECHVVLEELGRAAVASPFLASAVLATQALLAAGDDRLLPALADGETTAALGWGPGLTLSDGRLDGELLHVVDGARADVVLIMLEDELFELDLSAPGLRREALPTMDQSLHLAALRCENVPVAPIGPVAAKRIEELAAVAVTAEQVGGAAACLEQTVAYVKTREQFGRPIGSFQAIKHRLADLSVLVESAKTASLAAAEAWAAGRAELDASLAKAHCSEVYRTAAAEMIQLHGGVGITWEHPAHRYFKRAHSTGVLFGDAAYHRRKIADILA